MTNRLNAVGRGENSDRQSCLPDRMTHCPIFGKELDKEPLRGGCSGLLLTIVVNSVRACVQLVQGAESDRSQQLLCRLEVHLIPFQ